MDSLTVRDPGSPSFRQPGWRRADERVGDQAASPTAEACAEPVEALGIATDEDRLRTATHELSSDPGTGAAGGSQHPDVPHRTYGTLCIVMAPPRSEVPTRRAEAAVRPGRPRDAHLDASVDDAIEAVLLTSGYKALTVERVARAAATTRAAVYRRYRNRGSMVVGLLVARFGVDPAPGTGRLSGDLEELQRLQVGFFSHPVVRAAITGALSDVRDDHDLAREFHVRFIAPRRASVAELLRRAASRGEVLNAVDPAIVSDMLTGPLLLYACLPALGPLSDELVAATVQSALAILGAPTSRSERR